MSKSASILHSVNIHILALTLLVACGQPGEPASEVSARAVQKADPLEEDDMATEERPFFQAAKPFGEAIARKDYEAAFKELSGHAVASMSLNQFNPAEDDAGFERNEKAPFRQVSLEKFKELMGKVEAEFGTPSKLSSLSVFSTNPKALSGQLTGLDALETTFAIGAMPDTTPSSIRRASVRGQIQTTLSDSKVAAIAQDMGISVEELRKSEDFKPYLNFKVVLVEEAGSLKVGYFEFLPPSILD